ncbi:MAG TPA: NAD(P)-dependent oxidoreductase [Herbaspirillum sp.]
MVSIFLAYSPQARIHYYGAHALAQLKTLGDVRLYHGESPITSDDLIALAKDCRIIIASRVPEVPAEVFAQLPELIAYCRGAVDIRNIDVGAASRNGVLVTQATPGFAGSVSEWIIGAMIDLSRDISRSSNAYKNGLAPAIRMGCELRGATLGVVGYGTIARYLCKIANAFGMRILINDPYVQLDEADGIDAIDAVNYRQVSFDALLAESDYVVCLAVANTANENLFHRDVFTKMKKTAFFINASRGELLAEPDLLLALDTGEIAGAAIDVGRAADQMPSPKLAMHPLISATPHIAGLTPQAAWHQAMDTVNQVRALLAGQIPAGAMNAPEAFRLSSFSCSHQG